jgi:hypothetical protein
LCAGLNCVRVLLNRRWPRSDRTISFGPMRQTTRVSANEECGNRPWQSNDAGAGQLRGSRSATRLGSDRGERMLKLLARLRNRRKAVEAARLLCTTSACGEPIFNAVVCAEEPDRYVVRVFLGIRDPGYDRSPPWRDCWLVAVERGTNAASRIYDDIYKPRIL